MGSIIKQLNEKAKTDWEIKIWIENSISSISAKEWVERVDKKKWISIEDVTAFLADKVLIDQKQLTDFNKYLQDVDQSSRDLRVMSVIGSIREHFLEFFGEAFLPKKGSLLGEDKK